MRNHSNQYMRYKARTLIAVAVLALLSCHSAEIKTAKGPVLFSDEECRASLHQKSQAIDSTLQKPIKLRRQEEIEEEISSFAQTSNPRFYFYRVGSGGAYFDGPPLESLVAIDRQGGNIYVLRGRQSDANAFNTVVDLSRVSINSPDQAIALSRLYEDLTDVQGLSLPNNGTQMFEELTAFYDPTKTKVNEAKRRSLALLHAKNTTDLDRFYGSVAVSQTDGYEVSLYALQTTGINPSLDKIILKVHSNGTISNVARLSVAALGSRPNCSPSVFSACDTRK